MSDSLAARVQPADDDSDVTRIGRSTALRASDLASLLDASQSRSGRPRTGLRPAGGESFTQAPLTGAPGARDRRNAARAARR